MYCQPTSFELCLLIMNWKLKALYAQKKSVTCSGMFNKNIPTELIILRLSVNYIINWLVPTSTLLWLG